MLAKKLRFFNVGVLLIALVAISSKAISQTRSQCDTIIEKGIDALWKKEHAKSLELLTQARTKAEKNHWHKELYKATINIGSNYYAMHDYGEALNYYMEGYKNAVKNLEPKYEMLVLNNIAVLYSEEKNYDKAKMYFEKAYNTAKEIKDYKNLGLYALNLGNVANQTNDPVKARKYILEGIGYLKDNKETHFLMQANISLAENDLLLGKTVQARSEAQDIYKQLDKPEFKNDRMWLLVLIAKTYTKEQNYNEAITTVQKVFNLNPDVETKADLYRLLSKIYYKQQSYETAIRYKDLVITLDSTLTKIRNTRIFENSKVKFEILNYQNQIAHNQEKISAERKIFLSVLLIVIAIVIIVILMLRQKKAIAEKNQHIAVLQLEKEKSDKLLLEKQITASRFEKEQLQGEVESGNRKLSSKALYLSSRNELIEDILEYLSKKPKFSKDPVLSTHIQSLKNHLRSDNEWEDFIAHFENVNQGFLMRLKELHPGLSANDTRFIAYVYMNLSTKEIAYILNITLVAARKRKERITAKMEIPKDVELFDYISSI
ncbi:tetratricopeptide repeat protein [Flavobacterium zepuense]|uniref:Tetratricopeptide repeat protein n=1 Tax=Flavobacterium zepuense TaxID=2593302 RepID=A0A552VAG4_9FLAO|nr:tetratricopeptide repeat protein [Flavobacterium zepuense]TRW27478.1 tetratricopeptide repeat protein [Flavobacterium zepuense]